MSLKSMMVEELIGLDGRLQLGGMQSETSERPPHCLAGVTGWMVMPSTLVGEVRGKKMGAGRK